jgi:preprotein translocase subunit YajC
MGLLEIVKNIVLPIIVFIVLPLFFWYQRDRAKSRAEAVIAERTVGSKITTEEVGAMGASVAFVNEAFRMERESKDRQIKALQREVHEIQTECEQRVSELEAIINGLRAEIAELRKERQ